MKKMKLHHLCCVGTFIAHEVSKMLEATRLHITPILLISDNRVVIAVVFSVHTSSALLLHFVKTGALEDKRKQFLQATPGIQKCFRGLQSRSYFCELKNGVTTL
ncbi:uncharacterized protein [Medicago truncatula]|uniref:uncharacterized protein isoform X1 n=1 Tax=Medicago truncatula TaxID=3880 RepID=UPI00196750EF|nr:uncharacterized protein LOC25491221 isoform X1 [Medicago truncatula]XP_039689719.1 uncharacterized protein LOC25491221 isoform X1 [Medicago truncatula]